jgi:hypothetical protein
MTTISEIARAADVSVESVLQVLNRDEGVSGEIATRVEAVMDAYGYRSQPPEREPERGPKPGSSSEPSARGIALATERAGIPLFDRVTAIDGLFDRLAEDLDGIKNELGQARSERLEDLTLITDLLTTSWRTLDNRLRAIERKLAQMERPPGQLLEREEGER